jgi:hypothetical protein
MEGLWTYNAKLSVVVVSPVFTCPLLDCRQQISSCSCQQAGSSRKVFVLGLNIAPK